MKDSLKKPKISVFKFLTLIFSVILLLFTVNYYINYKYILITDSFYSEFNSCNFEEAKQIVKNDNFFLKLKKKSLDSDLNNYFSSVVGSLCNDLITNKINKDDALLVFNEIKSYEILNISLDKLILSLDDSYVPQVASDYEALLQLGIDSYNNTAYIDAIDLLKKIPETSNEYYSTATEYIQKCVEDYKKDLFAEADSLASNDYYTKAIDLLSNPDSSIISSDDEDLKNKISDLVTSRDTYLASLNETDNSTTSSTNILENITSNNVNSLYIESLTSYLVYVNLAEQITYVYTGSANNWSLEKSFICSTGIDEEATPTGIYDVRERGEWFYSDKYEQGGKYWVQFMGDYLFHSVPYNEDQSEVVDTTLGTPASHGCIRLKTNDAKWLYDNVDSGTKIIIN